jgi:hypothetical protein
VTVEENAQPHRHQIVEVPPIKPLINNSPDRFYSENMIVIDKKRFIT